MSVRNIEICEASRFLTHFTIEISKQCYSPAQAWSSPDVIRRQVSTFGIRASEKSRFAEPHGFAPSDRRQAPLDRGVAELELLVLAEALREVLDEAARERNAILGGAGCA
jgi:hypothetical protein